jgi:hypothetical protein
MKNLSMISLLLFMMVSWLMPSPASCAENEEKSWLFQPRLTTGMMHYKFEYTFTAPGTKNEVKFLDSMPFIGGGAMLFYNKCFADTYFQLSATGKDGSNTVRDTEYVIYKDNNEFDRKDYAITFGCIVVKKLSFFAGYKNGKTDIHIARTQNWPYERRNEENTGDIGFETDGFFLGVAYSHPIGDGQFGVKLAAGKLEAEYNQHNVTRTNNRAVGDGPTQNEENWFFLGNTRGFTYGANWTAPVSKHFSYRISLDYFDYDFDTDSVYMIRNRNEQVKFMNIHNEKRYDVKETMFSLQLQLLYQF